MFEANLNGCALTHRGGSLHIEGFYAQRMPENYTKGGNGLCILCYAHALRDLSL